MVACFSVHCNFIKAHCKWYRLNWKITRKKMNSLELEYEKINDRHPRKVLHDCTLPQIKRIKHGAKLNQVMQN